MTGEFFSKVHVSLTGLLSLQKSGKDVRDVLTVLLHIINECREGSAMAEWGAVRSAVVVTLRVAADEASRHKTWNRDRTQYAKLICCLIDDKPKEEQALKCSLGWKPHIRPLLAILLSDVTGDNQTIHSLVRGIKAFTQFILDHEKLREELLSLSSIPLFGKLVSVCLEVIQDERRNSDTRIDCLSVLQVLIDGCSMRQCSAFLVVLPGIVSQLTSVAIQDATQHLTILVKSCQVISSVVILCLSDISLENELVTPDASIDPSFRALMVDRNQLWIGQTVLHLKEMLSSLSSRLCVHRDELVRKTVFSALSSVHLRCGVAFGATLDELVFDTALILCRDPFDVVASVVSSYLETVRESQSRAFSLHLHHQLMTLSERLPLTVRQSIDSQPIFSQLASLLACLGDDCLRLSISRAPSMVSLIRSLAASVRFDLTRIMVCRSASVQTITELLSSLPLQFGVEIGWISTVCKELANHAGLEIVDVIQSEMSDCSLPDRVGLLFLAVMLLQSVSAATTSCGSVLLSLTEQCVDDMRSMPTAPLAKDHSIHDLSQTASLDTVSAVCLISCVASCSVRIPDERVAQRTLIDVMYQLLQLCSHSDWIVKDAANTALHSMAKASSTGKTVSEYLFDNAIYVVNRVSLASRSPSSFMYAPLVLSEMIDRVNLMGMFEHVRYCVESLLRALDMHSQEWALVVLRAVLSFVSAMNRWFPCISPMENNGLNSSEEQKGVSVEDSELDDSPLVEEEKSPPPAPVKSVEQVLIRTKHLLSSPHYPVRLVVVDILREGLHFLRSFEDVLLPMVHQNWLSLVNRFEDNNLDVRRISFEVVHEMSTVSRTFVYRRIRDEVWPKVAKWMREQALLRTVHPHSSAFKYQATVLSRMGPIWRSIEMDDEDYKLVSDVLLLYSTDSIHNQLKLSALKTRKELEEYLACSRTSCFSD